MSVRCSSRLLKKAVRSRRLDELGAHDDAARGARRHGAEIGAVDRGRDEVEAVLDSAHALMDQGVFRYRRPPRPSRERVLEKQRRRAAYDEESYNELWRTLPAGSRVAAAVDAAGIMICFTIVSLPHVGDGASQDGADRPPRTLTRSIGRCHSKPGQCSTGNSQSLM